MNFENNLQKLRKSKNLSQGQLAEIIDVSRQSISKWESGTTYPEMDKLLQLSELFNVSLDELIKEKTNKKSEEKYLKLSKNEYNQRYQKLALGVAFGVALIIIGISIAAFIGPEEKMSALMFFIFLTFGVVLIMYYGISEGNLDEVKKIDYLKEEIETFNKKFVLGITLGVGIILFGIILTIILDMLNLKENFVGGFFLLCISFAVFLFVYFGIQKDKFNGPKKEIIYQTPRKVLLDKICGVIMLLATIIFFILGLFYNLWHPGWGTFLIGGLLCAIASIILD